MLSLSPLNPVVEVSRATRLLKIKLPSSSDGGYTWMPLLDPGQFNLYRLTPLPPDLSSCEKGVVGCSGVEQFQLFLLRTMSGQQFDITFVNVRPFELPSALATAETATFTVKVK